MMDRAGGHDGDEKGHDSTKAMTGGIVEQSAVSLDRKNEK
jgi:hypothetical protein